MASNSPRLTLTVQALYKMSMVLPDIQSYARNTDQNQEATQQRKEMHSGLPSAYYVPGTMPSTAPPFISFSRKLCQVDTPSLQMRKLA